MGVNSVDMVEAVRTTGAIVCAASPFRVLSVLPEMIVWFVVETFPEQHLIVAATLAAILTRGFREGGCSLILLLHTLPVRIFLILPQAHGGKAPKSMHKHGLRGLRNGFPR